MDQREARARADVVAAWRIAREGRAAEAERRLRRAWGVLERRHRFAGAARAAATLGCLLRERGADAAARTTLERARRLFAVAGPGDGPPRGAGRRPDGPREAEDYGHAAELLAGDASAGPASRSVAGLREAVIAVLTALAGDAEPLRRVCEVVRDVLRARGVWIETSGGTTAVSGVTVPGAVTGATDGEPDVRVVTRGRGRHVLVVTPIVGASGPLAHLCVAWACRSAVRLDDARSLTAVAALACVPELDPRGGGPEPPGDGAEGLEALIGRSPAMVELRAAIRRAAGSPYPVLIEGETGSGKELVARALHRQSRRHAARFCAVNCAALHDELFEAELFGHARGAFTGAAGVRVGLFEEADGGTLFLDEVGELSPRAQAKLLRAVQEGEVRRLGENVPRRVDVRLVTATNRRLGPEAAQGRFRSDLLFRIGVLRLPVPPLRDRGDDIARLARHFWREALAVTRGRASLAPSTLAALAGHDWPGNVRELENVIARLAVGAPRHGWVGPHRLPVDYQGRGERQVEGTLAEARRAFERQFVRSALTRAGGRPSAAARELGLSRQGLAKVRKRLGIDATPPDPA